MLPLKEHANVFTGRRRKQTEFHWSGDLKMGGSVGIDGARSRLNI